MVFGISAGWRRHSRTLSRRLESAPLPLSSDTIIRVESLGKKYLIGHQTGQSRRQSYKRFSDLVLNAAKALVRCWRNRGATPRESKEEFWALQDVSFEIQRGDVIGIIGRNGAGKSTLLKILSGITEPTTGRVEIDGRVASLLEVGTGFHPELTGRENIFLNGAILGMTRAEIRSKFDEIVAFAEVERFLDTPVKRYSSGMYVRLAFAVAAHLEPEILIVDEVLAVGDVQFQRKCLNRMKSVSRDGRTVLFVSHNMDAIAALCGRAIVLEKGAVVHDGAPSTAIALYVNSAAVNTHRWTGRFDDEHITLLETWVKSRSPDGILHTAVDLEIGIRLEVKRPIHGLILGYNLFSEQGYELIYSLHDDSKNNVPETTQPGKVTRRFIIPANMLAAGRYRIDFDVGIHMVKRIIMNPVGTLDFRLDNISGVGRHYISPEARGYRSLIRPSWPVEEGAD